MELVGLDSLRTARVLARARASVLANALALVLFGGTPVALAFGAWSRGLALPGWAWLVAAPVGLVALAIWGLVVWTVAAHARASLRPTSWALKVTRDGLYAQLRHFANHHLSTPARVVFVPWSEVEHVRRVDVVRDEVSPDDTWRRRYLDVHLRDVDTRELAAAIAAEVAEQPPSTKRLGITSSGRVRGCPVGLRDGRVLRLPWPGRRVARAMDPFTYWNEPDRTTVELGRRPPVDVDDQVLELVLAGETLEAIRVLRHEREMGLAEAKQLVDELAGTERRRAG